MKSILAMLTVMLSLVMTDASAAGLKLIDIPADAEGPALKGAVWYPCAEAPSDLKIGPISAPGTKDCPVMGNKLPLVVISHGAGGWFGGHHDVAETLANAGFVVAAIDHPLDSGRSKIRRPGDIASMTERPTDIKRLIDYMLSGWPDSSRIDPQQIGFFGFSRGGFTGLALIGGSPDFQLLLAHCPTYPGNHWCEQIRNDSTFAQSLTHDRRIKAAVIADPGLGAEFTANGLKDVTVPVQLWASAFGGDGVSPEDAATVSRNLPTKPDYRVVPNSGHFAFMAPCDAEFTRTVTNFGEPEICTDANGFDRVAFHRYFDADVLAFFRSHLAQTGQP
ncbi:alpha/beta hydrolase family protein [Paraburkholderia phenazinium]|jgi:predicted dienelactone hydrolase|uniref:alpha/beta hydrolase family protein n=1 Tax=Paraburkholderia phenazinium TaxID=60549 RepID=UPI001589DE16|nr:alpha/beta hydrolase [Paraburkholderia phenazinium]